MSLFVLMDGTEQRIERLLVVVVSPTSIDDDDDRESFPSGRAEMTPPFSA
jgi:hypothetical protein